MLRLETGMRDERGFTLIEILIVILIIGISASVALLAFGDFGASRKALVTAEQFSNYLKLVQQRAILEMSTLGININKNGYETYRFEQAKTWKPMAANSLFHWQPFPKNVVVTLKNSIKNNSKLPDIIISPSGDMCEFKLNFGTDSDPNLVTLIGQHDGELLIQTENK